MNFIVNILGGNMSTSYKALVSLSYGSIDYNPKLIEEGIALNSGNIQDVEVPTKLQDFFP